MFTLGTITCPRCAVPLRIGNLKVTDDWLEAEAELACPSCSARFTLLATLLPVTEAAELERTLEEWAGPAEPDPGPAPEPVPERVGSIDVEATYGAPPEPAPAVPPAENFGDGLVHVEGTPFDATEHRTADGTYQCPDCPSTAGSAQGLAAHHRQHVPKVPCPNGCGKLVNPAAGMTRHLRNCAGPVEPRPAPAKKASPPRASGRAIARVVSPDATAAARAAAKDRAPAKPAGDEGERPALPPLPTRSSWRCQFWMGAGAGACGIDKIDTDRGWKRARLPGGGHVDLCPNHRDASPAELRTSLEHIDG